jgi:starvation-inducible DNA-binding protein
MAQRPGATRTRTTGVRSTHTPTNGKTTSSTRSTRSSSSPTARPMISQRGTELQRFGTITPLPNGLDQKSLTRIVADLNQLLADTMTLRDLYKKHHWQVVGPTFYQLHLLFDKHYEEQVALVDEIAERIQLLGGLSIAMAADVAEMTRIERPPRGREEVPVQISRLLEAHEHILKFAHELAKRADEAGDDGTNDLVVSNVIRTNELQVWFVSEHLVDTPLVRAR